MSCRPELNIGDLPLQQAAAALAALGLKKLTAMLEVQSQRMPVQKSPSPFSFMPTFETQQLPALRHLLDLQRQHALNNLELNRRLNKKLNGNGQLLDGYAPGALNAVVHSGLLREIFSARKMLTVAPPNTNDSSVSQRKRGKRKDWRQSLSQKLRNLVLLVGRKLGFGQKHAAVELGFADPLPGAQVVVLPEEIWPTVYTLAFRDERVVGAALGLLRDHLLVRYFVSSGESPAPILHANTFCCLLLIVPDVDGGENDGLMEELLGVKYRLTEVIQKQIYAGGWAGFWDQWVLRQALQAFPNSAFVPPELKSALLALPYKIQTGSVINKDTGVSEVTIISTSPSNTTGIQPLETRHWEAQKPSWIDADFGVSEAHSENNAQEGITHV